LKEGLEKASWNQDNMNRTSCLAFGNRIGCSPFRANLTCWFYQPIIYYKGNSLFFLALKSARLQNLKFFLTKIDDIGRLLSHFAKRWVFCLELFMA
jgi:hypothetical protein